MAPIRAWRPPRSIADSGAKLELVSPERFFAPEMGGLNHVPYMRAFHEKGVTVTINTRLSRRRARDGNGLVATLGSDLRQAGAPSAGSTKWSSSTAPRRSTTSISRLKPLSRNRGSGRLRSSQSGEGDPFPGVPRGRTVHSCCALATPSPRAISMPPSMTAFVLPCGSDVDRQKKAQVRATTIDTLKI